MISFARRVVRRIQRFFRQLGPVVHRVELGVAPSRDEFTAALLARLESDGVPFLTGGVPDDRRPRIHVREADRGAVLASIRSLVDGLDGAPGVTYARPGAKDRPLSRFAAERPEDLTHINISVPERELATTTDRYRFHGLVGLDVWTTDPTSFKGARWTSAPRFNTVCTSMHQSILDEAMTSGATTLERWEGSTDIYGCDFPIDVVYTWVNDKDPEWRAIKDRYQSSPAGGGSEARKHHKERFNNRDELMYSLRSLEMFAPFVRKIHLVTMGQTPDGLDTSHPRIDMVDHRDIYGDDAVLPTFNSSSIETQLHHIEGLAEHFIYFNDDVFLGKSCGWHDFFTANGMAKFTFANHTIASSAITDQMEEYLVADRNAIELLRREFGFTVHRPMAHVPHPTRRSVLYQMEERFQKEFDACRDERFRSKQDLRPIAFMGHHYGYHRHTAVPQPISNRYLALWKPVIAAQLDNVLRTRRYSTFCINDVGLSPEREDEVNAMVASFLERYFPYPSSFEKGASGA